MHIEINTARGKEWETFNKTKDRDVRVDKADRETDRQTDS
jgi:hypothetical protein